MKRSSFNRLYDTPEYQDEKPYETPIYVTGCPYPLDGLNGRWDNEACLFQKVDQELNRNPDSIWKDVTIRIDQLPSRVYISSVSRDKKSRVKKRLSPIGTIVSAKPSM